MLKNINVREHNRQAWDKSVAEGNEWTIPVDRATIESARRGEWNIILTPTRPVPREWFPAPQGSEVLCLASGGGQQGPILAAAGYRVTVFDNSPQQLAQDRFVAERDGLVLATVEGDMADLTCFNEASFDLIIHPVSNVFVPDVLPVWAEAYRVLRPGGALLAGFMNPVFYIFDVELMDNQGILQVKHTLPYSDLESTSPEELQRYMATGWPLEFSHTLEEQIGGQLAAGFRLAGFYEDRDARCALAKYMPIYIATRAVKS